MIDCRDIEYREREVDIFEKYFVIYNQPQTIKKCIHKWTEEGTLSKIDNMIYTEREMGEREIEVDIFD